MRNVYESDERMMYVSCELVSMGNGTDTDLNERRELRRIRQGDVYKPQRYYRQQRPLNISAEVIEHNKCRRYYVRVFLVYLQITIIRDTQ